MKVVLLRPFVYSHRPTSGSRLTTETKFLPDMNKQTKAWEPTETTIPDDIWSDPWVSEQYADGAIERLEVTKNRMQMAHDRLQEELEANAKIVQQAEAAFARAQGAANVKQQRENTVADELNTPVNQLKNQQGADIGGADRAALDRELNTPVNVLQQRQSGSLEEPTQPEIDEPKKGRKGK